MDLNFSSTADRAQHTEQYRQKVKGTTFDSRNLDELQCNFSELHGNLAGLQCNFVELQGHLVKLCGNLGELQCNYGELHRNH
ncbi:unnamed protein product [Adineta steineri]|uniref:Uncharacterized protein n=1 Tax=Adineta steineri TaxID=433720 RepID=A0A815Q7A0_9BILA|nr:unnamed protein product [Adineta steineri]